MLFYLCEIPNTSVFDIGIMQDIVMERYKCYSNNNLEYDTSYEYDIFSHFIMCLIADKSALLHDMVIKGEIKLFSNKMTKMKADVVLMNIKHCLNFLNIIHQIEDNSSAVITLKKYYSIIKNILTLMMHKGKHAFHRKHQGNCKKLEMHVPFTFAVGLVAKRKVEVNQGKAKVPCGLWIVVLKKIFICFIEFEIKFLSEFHVLQQAIYEMEDDRLRNVIEGCMKKITGKISFNNDIISAHDIDEKCLYFPPCISNLHQILRQTHRLSYNSRYQYTLFLRDIGLPVNENVLFWKNEYTKPYLASSCTHFWEDKMSRYEYQIYHLYGLIGSKTQNTSHSCQKYIGKLTLKMDGGCPFAHLNKKALLNSLPRVLQETDIEDILKYKSENKFQRACATYLNSQKNYLQNVRLDSGISNQALNQKHPVSEILSPLHYYYLATGTRKK